MSDKAITLRYEYDEGLAKQAFVVWCRSTETRLDRILRILMALAVGVLIGGVVILFGAKAYLNSAVMGAFAMLVFLKWGNWRNIRKYLELLQDHEVAIGETTCTIDPLGLKFSSSVGGARLSWSAIDGIVALNGGTGLLSGVITFPLPDSALPTGMTGAEFQEILEQWRAAA